MTRFAPAQEGLFLLALTLGLVLATGASTLWLVVPVIWISFLGRPLDVYGLVFGKPGGILFHVSVVLAVFVPYAIGHIWLVTSTTGASFSPRLPDELLAEVFVQIVLIGLPEEVFFRGYLQAQLDRVSDRRWTILGARVGPGLPLAAALFALCHTLSGDPARLVTFFPGLFYGWLRARTGNVWVPGLYHAASNVLMKVVLAGLVVG